MTPEEITLKFRWNESRLEKVEDSMDEMKKDLHQMQTKMAYVSLVIGIAGALGTAVVFALVRTWFK